MFCILTHANASRGPGREESSGPLEGRGKGVFHFHPFTPSVNDADTYRVINSDPWYWDNDSQK